MNLNILTTQIIADVNTVQTINQITLKINPAAPPSKDMPLSASLEDDHIIPQGASERPNVHIAINAFFFFAFHSRILDIFNTFEIHLIYTSFRYTLLLFSVEYSFDNTDIINCLNK